MRPYAAADIGTWDLTTDVVVAGYGVAGAAAAVEAARAGAEVLVLERAGGWGGAAALAGGFIYLGGGTALQRACGFDDSPEAMAAFLMAAMGPGADTAKISAYCEGSVAHFDWLVECGVPFKPVFYGEPAWEPAADEGLMYSGGENAHPFDEIAQPAPRGHLPRMENKRTGERGGGYMLMKPLVETAERLGVNREAVLAQPVEVEPLTLHPFHPREPGAVVSFNIADPKTAMPCADSRRSSSRRAATSAMCGPRTRPRRSGPGTSRPAFPHWPARRGRRVCSASCRSAAATTWCGRN
ncbi:FAD-dependent oxidoreductase [Streptomyces sp. NPDC001292]|uniref:FAD-dependent oxidoreductase n=1 Tax=Streptomyces sp. NPDC001292 TaxID=3364558 RepID=UPI00369964D4